MRHSTLVLCAILGITAFGRTAFAARNVEVVQHPSLLMIGDINQMLGVSYSFTDHSGTGSTGSTHALSERYNLSTVAAILDPDLVTIQVDGGIIYQQAFASKTSNYINGQYNLIASVMPVSPYPVTVSSTRDTSLIANGYTSAYTLTTDNNQVTASILHETLPVQFSYAHGSSESSGLQEDYSSSSDTFSASVSHSITDRVVSQAVLDYSSTAVSNGRSSRAYSLFIDNNSTLDEKRRYVLSSKIHLQEIRPVDLPQRTLSLTEALSCRFGAALLGSVSYDFSDSSTVDFSGVEQTLQAHTVTASISHRLYASLSTGLTGAYSTSEGFGGGSTTYGGTFSLNYHKLLPAQSSLSASGSYSHKITDQRVLVNTVDVRDEQHTVTQQGEKITLTLAGNLTGVQSVRSLNPDLVYLEGTDYRVNLALGFIEVLVGGGIAPGTILFISYETAVNPSITYQSDSYNTGYVLTLFSGRYTVGGDLSILEEKLLSGQASNTPLNRSTNYNLRAEARYGTTNMGAEFAASESTSQKYSRAGAHLNYSTLFSRNDSFSFNLRDDYFMYPASQSTSTGYNENSISAGASYATRLFQFMRAAVMVGITDNRSKFGSGDTISFRVNLNADYRKLSLSMNAMTLYRITDKSTNRDTNINIAVSRSF